ncbi:MAG: DUF2141 domain-containing protein [Nitrospirales bacterium]|nr:DUF2141 domain-containing protein [Nitrospirales bacterium]
MLVSARMKYTQELCQTASHMILVQVQQVRSAQGLVTAVLYGDKPDDFLAKGKKLAKIRVPAQQDTVHICLIAPNPGRYALVVYHDENGNKKFDKNMVGLPIEGFGISNNPEFFLVPPHHDEAAFLVVNDQTSVAIAIKY